MHVQSPLFSAYCKFFVHHSGSCYVSMVNDFCEQQCLPICHSLSQNLAVQTNLPNMHTLSAFVHSAYVVGILTGLHISYHFCIIYSGLYSSSAYERTKFCHLTFLAQSVLFLTQLTSTLFYLGPCHVRLICCLLTFATKYAREYLQLTNI